jgi:hypothetical protein
VFEFSLSNLLLWIQRIPLFTNGTAGSADYTTTSQTVTVAGATTGTVVYQQLLILLMKMRPLLPLERLRLLEQSMIMMRLNCSHDHSSATTEGSPAVFEFSLSNLLLWIQRIPLHSPMDAGSADYTTTSQSNCTCGCYWEP